MTKLFTTQLHIFQLEGYMPLRFLRWWVKNPFQTKSSQKVPLNYTWKVKTLQNISIGLLGFCTAFSYVISHNIFVWIIPVLLWGLVPFVYLLVAWLLLKPYEIFNKRSTINQTRKAILSNKNLIVIGVTGSFGKTTTKDFLAEILSVYGNCLKTPQSYNTIFGIAKVVRLELTSKVKYFICEMGAYVRGEIETLTYEVPPQYAILTAIGSQHLERFKTIQNTTLAKFELVDAVQPHKALVNLDNPYICEHIKNAKYKGVQTYGINNPEADYSVSQYKLTEKGIQFLVHHANKNYAFETSLFGTSSLQNLTAAISMALMLEVPYETIRTVVSQLKPPHHRLELKPMGRATLIDDAYSSNEQGFKLVINDLGQIKGKKALITPGIVELGSKTYSVHKEIGKNSADVFDTVVLVGKSERTQAIEEGLNETKTKTKVEYLVDNQLWSTIEKLSQNHDWILLENDLPDNY